MLSYAFRCLQHEDFEKMGTESFSDANNLLAAILAKGVAQILKQGLYREYSEKRECVTILRGKIDISETIRNRIHHRRDVVCEIDELTEDNQFNQILKTTMSLLANDKNVKQKQKEDLRNNLLYFSDVREIDPIQITWSTIRYQRNNQLYRMLLAICRLVLKNMLQNPEGDDYLLETFSDKVMYEVFEHFVFEYYRQDGKKRYKGLGVEHGAWIDWDFPESQRKIGGILPVMISDVMLHYKKKTLIIDTKYYGKIFLKRSYAEKEKIRSNHVYQIFAYVKNYDASAPGDVSGLLLYAKTEHEDLPGEWFSIGGSRIGAKALDLNQDFEGIKNQLNLILDEFVQYL